MSKPPKKPDILTGSRTFTSLPPVNITNCTKKEIKEYFTNAYDLDESIFLCLKEESTFLCQPNKLRLPLIFYYGHTAAVYVNKLILGGLLKERVNLQFETMFETGVNELAWDDTENYRMGGTLEWPPLSELVEYRRQVRQLVLKVIEETPLTLPIRPDNPWWSVLMGIEHERVHMETTSVLLRQLPVSLVQRPLGWSYAPTSTGKPVTTNRLLPVNETVVTLGKFELSSHYGWDIDYGSKTCSVPAFEASEFLVTNREFLEFVQDGGYQSHELWTKEGSDWLTSSGARHPSFWVCDKGCPATCGGHLNSYSHCLSENPDLANKNAPSNQSRSSNHGQNSYHLRLMFDEIDLPLDWPVEVNYHEAKAFCQWKGQGYRLPGEAELWAIAGDQSSDIAWNGYFTERQKSPKGNMNLKFGSSTPVNLLPPNNSGFYDSRGNIWQWTEDHINALPGFKPHHLYDDYSQTYFDGMHNVLLGGSWISSGTVTTQHYRNFFRRHFYQHSGFRLVRSNSNVTLPITVIDTEVFELGSGLQNQDFKKEHGFKGQHMCSANPAYLFDPSIRLDATLKDEYVKQESLTELVLQTLNRFVTMQDVQRESALHIGAATGRICFELSKDFGKVLGVDVCARQIDAAMTLWKGGSVTLQDGSEITLSDKSYRLNRVVLKQLTWLPNEVGFHDVVIVTLLDRIFNAKSWLIRLWEITRPNGLLVIASGLGLWTQDKLQQHLSHSFQCLESVQQPFNYGTGPVTACITVWKHI